MEPITMADTTHDASRKFPVPGKPWIASALILLAIAVLDTPYFWPAVTATLNALAHTGVFIAFAVLAVAFLKATGAETLLAKAFEGSPVRMIFMAALLGGLSPFCSCEVIPFIAALLAVGAPLAAVMAFWLASPLMDPAMFAITAGAISYEFALAKTVAALSLGLFGGFGTLILARSAIFADPLRENPQVGGCCGVQKPFSGAPVWKFWQQADRLQTFWDTAQTNAMFLLKWLTLAYVIEAVMVHYIPADLIAQVLGGTGVGTIILGALVGMPAYLNGYAAAPLVAELMNQGMANGAAMSFMLAGGVSCIPAAIAVWALVKPKVFFAYLSFAMVGAILAGLVWQSVA